MTPDLAVRSAIGIVLVLLFVGGCVCADYEVAWTASRPRREPHGESAKEGQP